MVFSSTVFLFIFLALVWAIYSLVPIKHLLIKNIILSVASIVFYAYGEPIYVLLMVASVVFNYFAAIIMDGTEGGKRKFVLTLAVIVNLLALGFFKYVPWLVRMVNDGFGISLTVPKVSIPVGISFYTFQILSYVIDVYRRNVRVQRNFPNLFLYISFFPQLIAGPIVKYADIEDQIENRTVTLEKTAVGIKRFIIGLSKKVLISNTAAIIADAAFGSASPSSALAWAGAFSYCIQLFFDFSGYSDMAIGLASIFGFKLNENFIYPYSAVSINDFWKRWHISLTSWFREYVYFPLGGSRCSKPRAMLNRFIVFALSGLWHGANLTYIVWGIWHGLLMVFEQWTGIVSLSEKKAFRPVMRLYTLLAVLLGFVVFRAESISLALAYIGNMFAFSGNPADALLCFSPWTITILVCAVIFSVPVIPYIKEKASKTENGAKAVSVVGYVIALILFALSVGALVSSSFNPFIYYIF